jgi:DNA-binding MarR family transcriptional regulator
MQARQIANGPPRGARRASQYIVSRCIIVAGSIISGMEKPLSLPDFCALAEFRYSIRRYLHFSEQAARDAGVEPKQYQLMLALKGMPTDVRPRIGELAERLQIRHHSTVELVNRLAQGGYVRRRRDSADRREVLVSLTAKGEKLMRTLALHHQLELRSHVPDLVRALRRIMANTRGARRSAVPGARRKSK